MAQKSQGVFSVFKGWAHKHRITVINAAITIALIAVIVVVLLWRAVNTQRKTAEESLINLAGMTTLEIQAYYDSYFNIARTVSQIMSNYQTVNVNQRRSFFNETMQGVLLANRGLISIYTLWRPNALDGMDAAYSNTEGTDETGQYTTGYTRARGWVEQQSFGELRYLMIGDDTFLSGKEVITEPAPRTIAMINTWAVDVRIPIIDTASSASTGQTVVGIIGITINLEQLQYIVGSIRPYGTGQAMMCSANGMVVAHYNQRYRGINLRYPYENPDKDDVLFAEYNHVQVWQVILNSIHNLEPSMLEIQDTIMISHPLLLNNIPWAVVTTVPLSTVMAPLQGLIRFSVIFIIASGGVAATVMYLSSRGLTQRALALQHDLEQATTMQDNLKYGLFLIDQNFLVQGAYSKAVERILSVTGLQGKSLLVILSASLKQRELNGVQDYLTMIFKRSYDAEMLEGINPLNEFEYVSGETREQKNLRCGFTFVEWGRDAQYILCTLEDISAEKKLAKQLTEAENARQKEMQSIFQVIQLNPRVLGDFIEDTEYEFDQVNQVLQNRKLPPSQVLGAIYQSVHAIKSDALILNLDGFGASLHKLETSIKLQREKKTVSFDETLGIVLELEMVMREKDTIKSAITRIEKYRQMSGGNIQEVNVLVETLTRICKKAQDQLNKQVRFIQGDIDEGVLVYGPRRIIKEILIQIVRNAIYHGIESPEERTQAGKEPVGEIHLSIQHADGAACITISDNGKGIDYTVVRQRAERLKLIGKPADANNKNFLTQTLFNHGFTTVEEADMHAGRGVGLSLVKDKIRELKGAIKVRSDEGKGTAFVISFPLELPDEDVSEPASI